jgi:hypothetical protein
MIKFFQKSNKLLVAIRFRNAVISGAFLLLTCSSSLADECEAERSSLVGLKKSSFPPITGLGLYSADTTLKGIRKPQLMVGGTIRFLTIYRNMQESYEDMITSDRNISFLDYPLANVGVANFGGFPLLELNMQAKISPAFSFNVGYSFGHSFIGASEHEKARNVSSRQNLYFTGRLSTDVANFSLSAGGILWTSISRFTMGQPNYRDNYFERLPWDWYRNSFLRYEEYYTLNMNLGGEAAGRSPVQGFIGIVDFYKIGLKVHSVFGRTNRSVAIANASTHFPSYTYGGKIEKSIFTPTLDGRVSMNFYTRSAKLTKGSPTNDLNQIVSIDSKMKIKKVIMKGEVGLCHIDNPASKNKQGTAVILGTEISKKISPVPFEFEVYNIDYNFASIDGSVMNTNTTVRDGGFATEFIYDNMLLINIAQEVGMIANNRRGLHLNGEANISKIKVQFGIAASQEIENRHDTLTIQHRVNAFSRSRFRPWFQASGPYGRIKSGWRRTYETLTITDDPSVSDTYKKGFNTLELLLKYRTTFLGKDLVIMNFYAFNSIQDRFSPIPDFSDKSFVRLYFADLTAALKLTQKASIVGYAGIEKVLGGMRVDLADDQGNRINGADGKPAYDPNGNTIDQTGLGFGLGIDYDVNKTTGLHLRHTWMNHKDKNFTRDVFKGQETTFELKIFF